MARHVRPKAVHKKKIRHNENDKNQAREVMQRQDSDEPLLDELTPEDSQFPTIQSVERRKSYYETRDDKEQIHAHPTYAEPDQPALGWKLLPPKMLDCMVDYDGDRRKAPEHVDHWK